MMYFVYTAYSTTERVMKIRRTITIDPDVWAELKKEAKRTGRSASGLIDEMVRKLVKDKP